MALLSALGPHCSVHVRVRMCVNINPYNTHTLGDHKSWKPAPSLSLMAVYISYRQIMTNSKELPQLLL